MHKMLPCTLVIAVLLLMAIGLQFPIVTREPYRTCTALFAAVMVLVLNKILWRFVGGHNAESGD